MTRSLRFSSFQVVSIITTTGFASTDFSFWPESTKFILLLIMKYGAREIYKSIHPKMVKPIRLGDTVILEDVMQGVFAFFVLYLLVFVGSSLVLSILGLDFMSSISASATTLGNVGPGLSALVGPMSNFGSLHVIGKFVLIFNMWVGRLEVMNVLVLFVPSF